MARSLLFFQVLLITCLTSCGPSAKDIEQKRFADSIVRSDSIVRVRVEQNKIFSTETIKSLIVGKWVLDSSTSTSIIPEQKDPMYLKNYGRIRPDGQVVLFCQKSFVNKEDFYQSYEYKNNQQLITHNIYNGGVGYRKHFDQKEEYSYNVTDSTITYWFILDNERKVGFKSIIRNLTSNKLYFRLEDAGSNDQLFYFSKLKE